MAKKKLYDENGNVVKGKLKKPFYKKIWFWLLVIVVVGYSLNSEEETAEPTDSIAVEPSKSEESAEPVVTSDSEPTEEIKTEPVVKEEPIETNAEEQYQTILDEYTQKIKEAAPKLVEEYNAEYPNNQGGLEGLAELSNDKISDLAEISNDGISAMAEVHFTKGSGKYEDYEEWASNLMDIYMEESGQITDAYMNSAQ
ncbi:hypothetical protein JHE06_07500 [Carnobacterium sp. CS13]|uniref:hypothetical protein n=1 Tax=Carnobacterium sp. CS13 TaxID=2800128 RepID=UPI0019143B1A|nr:hypothetical protein [Carnobacterium sp. CS13]QQP69467.1 hypothetical protein JHE06_07500 [Carnobacterium sp. CS13]